MKVFIDTNILIDFIARREQFYQTAANLMGQCYFQLKQRDKAKDYFNRFLEATENKEYNDKIKDMRSAAQRTLRMMMW